MTHADSPSDETGQPAGTAAEAQASCEQLARQLAATQAELEDFTYSVSHDLRASLRHITAFVALAREDLGDKLPPGVASHLDTVTQSAKHMGRMIDGLSELSRLGHAEIKPEPVPVGVLVNSVRTELSHEPCAAKLEWQVSDDLPNVLGDAAMVRQLWRHLLSNAIKYSSKREQATVQVGWTRLAGDAAQVRFFVQDNGAGFNPRFVQKMFHAFQRLHSGNEFEGLGMGLVLSRKIVERHGGTIEAQGDVDAGCRISFTLPRVPESTDASSPSA
ncbi:MAG: hypothetical protein KJ852_16480 [Gammaproteobacteria bacterium]|nr:hypothetical protein [Gammaproteobacteria bacterium]MBU0786819.1 hypothetical protein [Gammaproteobacteria bacterium]MBU0813975.1 hypothetical protein [Gammaproteobacteria bacterium]MBU1788552.1 hypothetical protein [Gammaproteobacteria bacterium]